LNKKKICKRKIKNKERGIKEKKIKGTGFKDDNENERFSG
jgi:hypothetical protein